MSRAGQKRHKVSNFVKGWLVKVLSVSRLRNQGKFAPLEGSFFFLLGEVSQATKSIQTATRLQGLR